MITVKKTKKRWTTAEIKTVYKQVSLHPENLTLAFENASRLIDRSAASISAKWYIDLKFRKNVSFATIGHGGAYRNAKVKGTKTKLKKGFWKKLKELFL